MDNSEEDQIHQALSGAYFFLKFRPRSEKEIREYLIKKAEKFHWKSTVVEAAISSLKEQNYINDDEFVEWFVYHRKLSKPKSAYALKNELHRFGVDRDNVSEYFEQNPIDEEKLALAALQKRWPRYQNLDKKEQFQKAAAFLSRRGFNFDIIKKCIDHLNSN